MRGLDWRGTLSRGELGVISEGGRLDGGSEWGDAERCFEERSKSM